MNKTIIGFIAGQLLQLLILVVALMLTYATNTLLFCAIFGAASTLILMIGVMLERFEQIQRDEDEVAPLPKGIKVTNDKVEKVPTPPKTGSNAEHKPKHIKISFEGEPSPLMEETLKEATK